MLHPCAGCVAVTRGVFDRALKWEINSKGSALRGLSRAVRLAAVGTQLTGPPLLANEVLVNIVTKTSRAPRQQSLLIGITASIPDPSPALCFSTATAFQTPLLFQISPRGYVTTLMNARSSFRRLRASKYSEYLSPAHEKFLTQRRGRRGLHNTSGCSRGPQPAGDTASAMALPGGSELSSKTHRLLTRLTAKASSDHSGQPRKSPPWAASLHPPTRAKITARAMPSGAERGASEAVCN